MPGVQRVPQLTICAVSKQSVLKVLTFVPIKRDGICLQLYQTYRTDTAAVTAVSILQISHCSNCNQAATQVTVATVSRPPHKSL
jgi:hypothetical protein